ncbi:MAG: host-nuclease inhibitor Gam family protein [Bacteroidota bacterium]
MRKRIETEPALKSWEDADLHLLEIREHEIAIESIKAKLDLEISNLKLEANEKAKVHIDRIAALELELKEFVTNNRADIKGKTKELKFGKTGFRASGKIIIRNVKNAIAMLKNLGLNDCIKIKETVNRANLKNQPDDILAQVGASRNKKDVFWYETKREKFQETA